MNPFSRRLLLARFLAPALAVFWAQPSSGSISVSPAPCVPLEGNGVVTALVAPDTPGSKVRLFFRRLNIEVEDFYYVEMEPAGAGQYWGVFPVPTPDRLIRKDLKRQDSPPPDPWAAWWRAKENSEDRDPNRDLNSKRISERAPVGKLEKRSWLQELPDGELQRFLERQEFEPVEYFVAVYDAQGQRVASSNLLIAEVRKDCRIGLTPQQLGMARNLTVGETNVWQKGEQPFHWECIGVVTRKDPQGILRADEVCRACVIAWWPYVAGAGAVGALVAITQERPQDVSPSRP